MNYFGESHISYTGSGASANDTTRDVTGTTQNRRKRRVLSAGNLVGDRVRNSKGEDLGKIEEIMIDLPTGRVAYAVLSFGGFIGIGDKLFAVPWSALQVDEGKQELVLDIDRKVLESAPGFDKNDWPDMADPSFEETFTLIAGQRLTGGTTLRMRAIMSATIARRIGAWVRADGRLQEALKRTGG